MPESADVSPESVQCRARLLPLLERSLVDAGYLAPAARLGRAHKYPARPDLGPVVLRERTPPAYHDAAPGQET